jgi:hypothetical protein
MQRCQYVLKRAEARAPKNNLRHYHDSRIPHLFFARMRGRIARAGRENIYRLLFAALELFSDNSMTRASASPPPPRSKKFSSL